LELGHQLIEKRLRARAAERAADSGFDESFGDANLEETIRLSYKLELVLSNSVGSLKRSHVLKVGAMEKETMRDAATKALAGK
jgi:hypothetical protein